jgi:hypothetical protein
MMRIDVDQCVRGREGAAHAISPLSFLRRILSPVVSCLAIGEWLIAIKRDERAAAQGSMRGCGGGDEREHCAPALRPGF